MLGDELVITSLFETESRKSLELVYYIQTSVSGNERIFGLRVDKKDLESGKIIESGTTPAFSDNYDTIRRMAELFAKETVTPGVLIEMCDEYIS